MLKIGFDAFTMLDKNPTGISNYLNGILNVITEKYSHNFLMVTKKKFIPKFKNCTSISSCYEKDFSSFINTLWVFTVGTRLLNKELPDIYWASRQMLPPFLNKKIYKVLTVYDLVYKYYPETMSFYNRLINRIMIPYSIKHADKIVTISKSVADSIKKEFNITDDKIEVVTPAASGFEPLEKISSSELMCQKYSLKKNYLLTVSTLEPRKNLPFLLELLHKLKDSDLQLVVVGAKGWKTTSLMDKYTELELTENEVKFLGFVPSEDINKLYSGAKLFLFPSLYEGFGMPVLEAMKSGTPVIVSGTPSLMEVVGDAGVILSVEHIDDWILNIKELLNNSIRYDNMIKSGLLQAEKFGWEKSADGMNAVFLR